MQVFGLPRHVIRNGKAASRLLAAKPPNSEAARRRDALARWQGARGDGLTAEQAAQAVGVPCSTLYRWNAHAEPKSRKPHRAKAKTWTSALVSAVERLRLDFPMWGRDKIGPLLREEGFAVSNSTAGRILCHLVARGLVMPVPALRKRPHKRRWSAARRLATRLPREMKPARAGDLVQIDTVFVNLRPGKSIKHFTAYDPVAKWTVGQAFNRATAVSAAKFLDKVVAQMPFEIRAIQVDGGSEFMAQFETACAAKGIKPFVLPPKSPKLNGAVERCNGAWRYEFYETYDLPANVEALNPILDSYQHLYNHHRPHGALGGIPPVKYLPIASAQKTPLSHMS